jgi:hypothetical protein
MFRGVVATVIAYIDGFNLYHGLRDKYRRRYLWLDLGHLLQRLRPNDDVLAVRYFTALVRDDPVSSGSADLLALSLPGTFSTACGHKFVIH